MLGEEYGGCDVPSLMIYRGVVAAVARKAHNLEVGGSIPSPATKNNLKKVEIAFGSFNFFLYIRTVIELIT